MICDLSFHRRRDLIAHWIWLKLQYAGSTPGKGGVLRVRTDPNIVGDSAGQTRRNVIARWLARRRATIGLLSHLGLSGGCDHSFKAISDGKHADARPKFLQAPCR